MRSVWIPVWLVAACTAAATVYHVGTNQPLTSIGQVPWTNLVAGDHVRIHWRTTPYNEKWVICGVGTPTNPITISGVPNASNELPVIDGRMAVTPTDLDYWNEIRAVVKVGGSSHPSDSPPPSHITIENLDIRSGRPPYWFYDDHGISNSYSSNAAAIFIERGTDIAIRHCVLHDCGNGIQSSTAGGLNSNLLIHGCTIYDNGISNRIYEHNTYTEFNGITYEFNYMGPLRQGCGGNNLKDRSAGTVIRYNVIENGNRQMDLVDGDTVYQLPSYSNTYVYGNILIEATNDGNRQIIHYGGDSGSTNEYRNGTLHFFNNTVISRRSDRTTLFRLSTERSTADCFQNILYVTLDGNTLAMLDADGVLNLQDNWSKPGWVGSFGTLYGTINELDGNVTGASPGFVDEVLSNYHLSAPSACIDAATNALPPFYPDRDGVERPLDGDDSGTAVLDMGAYEYVHATADTDNDLQSDWDEVIAGVSPTNALESFAIGDQRCDASAQVITSWQSRTGRYYDVQTVLDPTGTWGDAPGWTNIIGTGDVLSFTNQQAGCTRIRVSK